METLLFTAHGNVNVSADSVYIRISVNTSFPTQIVLFELHYLYYLVFEFQINITIINRENIIKEAFFRLRNKGLLITH